MDIIPTVAWPALLKRAEALLRAHGDVCLSPAFGESAGSYLALASGEAADAPSAASVSVAPPSDLTRPHTIEAFALALPKETFAKTAFCAPFMLTRPAFAYVVDLFETT